MAVLTISPGDQRSGVALDVLANIRAHALDELKETLQLHVSGSQQSLTELPWFANRLREAVRHIENGDAVLRRYCEQPDSAAWRETSREAYFEYVQAFREARIAQLAYNSLTAAGLAVGEDS